MSKPMKCEECGSTLTPIYFVDRGERFVCGIECTKCSNKIITSLMTMDEYRALLMDNETQGVADER